MGGSRMLGLALVVAGCRSVLGFETPVPLTDAVAGDDAAPIDAAPDAAPDAVPDGPPVTSFYFEAENYDQKVDGSVHVWETRTTEPGFSGPGYIHGLPNLDAICNTSTGCGVSVSYNFNVEVAGNYYLHVRSNADNDSNDSLWHIIDGNPAPALDLPSTGMWTWESVLVGPMLPGNHVLVIELREDGLRVDAIAIDLSMTAPP